MTLRTTLGLAAAAGVAAAVLGLVASTRTAAPPMPSRAAVALTWPDGATMRYRLEHRSNGRVVLAMPAPDGARMQSRTVEAAVDIVADVVVEPARTAEGTRLTMRLADVRTLRVVVLGSDAAVAIDDPAAHVALVELAPTGRVREVRFSEDSPELWRNAMQAVLADVQVTVAPARTWRVDERTMHGIVASDYAASGARLSRTRRRFADATAGDIAGTAAIELDARGHVALVDASETATVDVGGGARVSAASRTRFELDWL